LERNQGLPHCRLDQQRRWPFGVDLGNTYRHHERDGMVSVLIYSLLLIGYLYFLYLGPVSTRRRW
jgi:hypothetical protein